MAISKKKRQQVYDKFGGKCAYSGTDLLDDWQVDHIVPQRFFDYSFRDGKDDIGNLVPAQKIINHYKGALSVKVFKSWYLSGLHLRLAKLPKNPRTEKSAKKKRYLLEVASFFGITPDKPFGGSLYFERVKQ